MRFKTFFLFFSFLVNALVFSGTHGWFDEHTQSQAAEPPIANWDAAWVDAQITAWQPSKLERAFDQIAWAQDLTEAERLAKEHNRPIFLFTYDGANLACYRC